MTTHCCILFPHPQPAVDIVRNGFPAWSRRQRDPLNHGEDGLVDRIEHSEEKGRTDTSQARVGMESTPARLQRGH